MTTLDKSVFQKAIDIKMKELNDLIAKCAPIVRGQISDGYHTFDELYDHRISLYIALCKKAAGVLYTPVWRSKVHSDGSVWDGWFILGINREPGKQITYHLPISRWDECSFCRTEDKAPEWDGHNSQDVLERLKTL